MGALHGLIKPIELIGAGIGLGAKISGSELGPQQLEKMGLDKSLNEQGHEATWRCQLSNQNQRTSKMILGYEEKKEKIWQFNNVLSQEVILSQKNHLPVVVGGDHSIAIGTWSGLVTALQASHQFGLIWIDAHMDSHTPHTSYSHAIHGMPLAVLLGRGEPEFVNMGMMGAKLDAAHIALIGVRSFEKEEAELLHSLNVKVYYMKEVKEQGFARVFKDAVSRVSNGTKGFGVSVDLDAFDPMYAPGVGSPEKDGLIPEEVFSAFNCLSANRNFKCLEIAEFNPLRDIEGKTAKIIEKLIVSLK